ncbi:MAG: glycoside hydrolase family 9 protein [Candidatus Aenigmatarchaeota archaeon]
MNFRKILIICLFLIAIVYFYYLITDANNKVDKNESLKEGPKIAFFGPVCSDIISIVISDGKIIHGKQVPYIPEKNDSIVQEGNNLWLVRKGKRIGAIVGRTDKFIMNFDKVVGDRIDINLLDKVTSYRISSDEDNDFITEKEPYAVFRKTKPTDFARIDTGFQAPLEHIIYLKTATSLKVGKKYKIIFKDLNIPEYIFTYEPKKLRSEAVHINHTGFRPDDPVKVGFLSLWMGSGGPMDFKENTPFYLIDEKTDEVVYRGEVKLAKKASERDESAYGKNFNGTNVYIMDFSTFKKPGRYRIYVENIGCSYPFEIADDVWKKAFYTSVRFLYHQRSGIELGPPYTNFRRPRNFHPDDGMRIYATKASLYDVEFELKKDDNRFAKILRGKTQELVPDAWGGYCDAGDWDRRIAHLIAVRYLLELFDYAPEFFKNFDMKIPGLKEDFPDIIREVLWGIDFFRRIQIPEGGIRGGIESEDHPRYGEASWQESQMVFAFAPDSYSSYIYAASAAFTAYILKKYNMKNHEIYLNSAIKAMEWAERQIKGKEKIINHRIRDARNLAAIELFRVTGEKRWHDIFLETTIFNKDEKFLYKYDSHDQADAAWVYINTTRKEIIPSIKNRCIEALLNEARMLMDAQKKIAFKWTQNPWRPAIAGTFTIPDCKNIIRAHVLTGKGEYLESIILATQTGLGANPLNMCYTTGLGHKYPKNVMHIDSRVTNQPPPPGITLFGPLDFTAFDQLETYFYKESNKYCYPELKNWPVIENFLDIYWFPAMCEFSIENVAPNIFTWGYLVIRK